MSTQPQFAPADQNRFAALCAWCANGVSVQKNDQGDYVHFNDGRVKCEANEQRKRAEPRPSMLEQARECWESDKCPIDGNFKKARQYFFCKGCTWKLPKLHKSYLFNLYPGFELKWYEAKRMLMNAKQQGETTGAK